MARPASSVTCFNEAAGIPRGRPWDVDTGRNWYACASMRPRVFPAEDDLLALCKPCHQIGFNEAAGIPRGRPVGSLHLSAGQRCFNEAAGIPRGRLGMSVYNGLRIVTASMRPRVFPAEDLSRPAWLSRSCRARFNEAAGIPRGRPGFASQPAGWCLPLQ